MIQAIVKKGKVIKGEVLTPNVSDGAVLIKVINSCISPGTEISGIELSSKSLIKKAMEQPDKILKAMNWIFNDGIDSAVKKYKSETEIGNPTGYSLSGIIVGLGKNVNEFNIGDRVAAVGGGYANHAEYVDVPKNLVVKLPYELDFASASTAALGSIALNGIRRANLNIGEFAVVFGTGLIGLLTVQILVHAGIRVAAIDTNIDRLSLAKKTGAEIILFGDDSNLVNTIMNWSDGYGADAVLFTAATKSNIPLSNSFKMSKRKGKVILVGVSGMEIKRSDIYAKEIDFLISSSYGPGRYDKTYEEKGIDYPYAFVRWTERRNIKEYLRLLNIGAVKLNDLYLKIVDINSLENAFEILKSEDKPLGVILHYSEKDTSFDKKISVFKNTLPKDKINVALVGVGGFAKSIHLPNLSKLKNMYHISAMMSNAGYKAKGFADIYKPDYITNQYDDILNDENIDLIMITTQHANHGALVIQALQKGKNVFVEKPLAISKDEVLTIENYFKNNTSQLLMVGYNRRFSKYSVEIKNRLKHRINPVIINYRMNAGLLPHDHWIHEQGGRIIGEACHIFDLFNFIIESDVVSVNIESLNPKTDFYKRLDNKIITLRYEDGSLANLLYFSNGNNKLTKEYMEVHFDSKSIIMDNYESITGYGLKIKSMKSRQSEKGHQEELIALYNTLCGKNSDWPISLNDILSASQISFLADSE